MKNVFEFNSYKAYLREKVGGKGVRKGQRMALGNAISSNSTFISQVLNGDRDFSLEQGEAATRFLHLNKEETNYFMLLLQESRAGTSNLKNFFKEQREKIIQDRMVLKNRVEAEDHISSEYQARYYSQWIYPAIHLATMIPDLQTVEEMSKYFQLKPATVIKALEFLLKARLVMEENGKYVTGKVHIHLGNDSENIIKHHSNWRMKAIESLEHESPLDLHYSSAVTLSKSDISQVKDILIQSLKTANNVIKDSKEEEVFSLNIDFFSLKKS